MWCECMLPYCLPGQTKGSGGLSHDHCIARRGAHWAAGTDYGLTGGTCSDTACTCVLPAVVALNYIALVEITGCTCCSDVLPHMAGPAPAQREPQDDMPRLLIETVLWLSGVLWLLFDALPNSNRPALA